MRFMNYSTVGISYNIKLYFYWHFLGTKSYIFKHIFSIFKLLWPPLFYVLNFVYFKLWKIFISFYSYNCCSYLSFVGELHGVIANEWSAMFSVDLLHRNVPVHVRLVLFPKTIRRKPFSHFQYSIQTYFIFHLSFASPTNTCYALYHRWVKWDTDKVKSIHRLVPWILVGYN